MVPSHVCAICGAADNWRHSMLDCNMSRCIWALSNDDMVQHMCSHREENAKEWLFALNESLPQEEFVTMIVTLWAIWHARCKVIHEGIYQTPFSTHSFITSYLADLRQIKKPAATQRPAVPARPTGWIPPPAEHVKLNVDAAVSRAGGFGAIRTICRDSQGAFLGASAMVFRGIDDPEVLETLAIREALAISDDLYIQKVYVASDCKVAVEAIMDGTSASYGAVVHEIIEHSRNFLLAFLVTSIDPQMSRLTILQSMR